MLLLNKNTPEIVKTTDIGMVPKLGGKNEPAHMKAKIVHPRRLTIGVDTQTRQL